MLRKIFPINIEYLEHERKFIVGRGPAGDCGGDAEVHLEGGLDLLCRVPEVGTTTFLRPEREHSQNRSHTSNPTLTST